MSTTSLLHPLLFLLALALSPAGAAQVYSWKDASGKVHYGDRPPAEKQPQARRVPGAPAETEDVAAARKAAAERQFAERDKQARAAERAHQPAEDPAQAKARAENCTRARSNLAGLESGLIRFGVDARGERIALDGAAREAELARARKSVAEWCAPPTAR